LLYKDNIKIKTLLMRVKLDVKIFWEPRDNFALTWSYDPDAKWFCSTSAAAPCII